MQTAAESKERKPFQDFDSPLEPSDLDAAFEQLIGATSGSQLFISLMSRLREEYEQLRQSLDPEGQALLDQATRKMEEALEQFREILSTLKSERST